MSLCLTASTLLFSAMRVLREEMRICKPGEEGTLRLKRSPEDDRTFTVTAASLLAIGRRKG